MDDAVAQHDILDVVFVPRELVELLHQRIAVASFFAALRGACVRPSASDVVSVVTRFGMPFGGVI